VKSFKQYIIEKYNFGATAYGNADIDKTTAMEIQKGILKPSWQFLGNKNNPLVAGFSVANNKLPHGTIVKITDKQGNPVGAQFGNTEGIYRVDDTGGKNVYANIDFYSGSNRDMYDYFANLGKNNLVVTPLNLDSNSAEVRNITSRLGQYQGGKAASAGSKPEGEKKEGEGQEENPFVAHISSLASPMLKDFSEKGARAALKGMIGKTIDAVQQSTGKKIKGLAMNEDCRGIYDCYEELLEQQNQPLATLVGATGGGEGGTWGGSLPKLLSILPMGNWKASSLKRSRVSTRSGFMSDHYEGNKMAYAADFGLNSTFGGNVQEATNFALKVAQRVDPSVKSWEPYKGRDFKKITDDGYRVQIIWLSNVGGNHYDHVHVGVKKTNAASNFQTQEPQDDVQDTGAEGSEKSKAEGEKDENPFVSHISSLAAPMMKDFSAGAARGALKNMIGKTIDMVQSSTGKKII
jgi:3D (Asp-Asp-Asp) domain-containing protein/microcystin-dependent protein